MASDDTNARRVLFGLLVGFDRTWVLHSPVVVVVAVVFGDCYWKGREEVDEDFYVDYPRDCQAVHSAQMDERAAAMRQPHRPLHCKRCHRIDSPKTHSQPVVRTASEEVVGCILAALAVRLVEVASGEVVLVACQTDTDCLTVEGDGFPEVACHSPGCHKVGRGHSTGDSLTAVMCSGSPKRMYRVSW